MARKQPVKMHVDFPDGTRRHLGFLPQTDTSRMMAVPPYRDTTNLIPESQWVEFDEWPTNIITVKDQNGFSACNGHAAASAIEVARYVAGMEHVPISAWYIYAILCNGVDRGSMILDALKLTEDVGAAPASLVSYGIINPHRLTAEAHAAAPRYKIEIGSRLTTYEEIGTVTQRRQASNVAVAVGNNFNTLDSDGVAPLARGSCNHAVCAGLRMKKSRHGDWLVGITNSWTERWGHKGVFYEPIKQLVRGGYFEAYTVTATVDLAGDPTRPPKLA